ncbi:MAG TPA: LON peptidase substrate-binding domain-containing protein [Candidatus Bathyarchaeia archaeon]|nr:LON peptidase substrate-binding domain-containing protein [Candidatus Bathyarchaeia archaeon]
MEELPEIVPIFPLPNVVLFPHVALPLHIFEPRYREMVRDAMAGNRLIGMTLLRGEWRKDYNASPQVYSLGCVGRIDEFVLLPDGRSNLVLRGLRKFEIIAEVGDRSYRQARVSWAAESDREEITPALDTRLRAGVKRLLSRGAREMETDLWERLPAEIVKLVNTLAFALDLSEIDKLALLECGDVQSRAERLVEAIEFRLAERRLGRSERRDDEPRH